MSTLNRIETETSDSLDAVEADAIGLSDEKTRRFEEIVKFLEEPTEEISDDEIYLEDPRSAEEIIAQLRALLDGRSSS